MYNLYLIIYKLSYNILNLYKLKKNNIKKNIILKQASLVNESKYKPSSTKEWYNSVYSFNKNNQSFLTSINISIYKIVKWYFNMFSSRLERTIFIRRIAKWKRRLKLNKIFIGKPEFKHTNDKVIITLYVYNRELLLLSSKIKSLKKKILVEYFKKLLVKNKLLITKISIIKNTLLNIDLLKKRIENFYINFKKKKKKKSFKKKLFLIKKIIFNIKKKWKILKINFSKRKIFLAKSLKRVENKIKYSKYISKNIYILNYINNININSNDLYNTLNKSINIIPKFKLSKLMYLKLIKKLLIKIRVYLRYQKIIFFNKSKFNIHIIPLKVYIEKLYKKEVEFNIINLKNYKLDSNIFTEIMAIKLKNRRIKLNKIIAKLLNKIKLPLNRKLQYQNIIPKYKIQENLLIKNLINNSIYDMIPNIKLEENIKNLNLIQSSSDKLDKILKLIHPLEYTMSKLNINKSIRYFKKRDIKNTILDNIENKVINGIRIETSGRLSKRITAAKSVFKMKQKGTLKNINSSYKKLPSILLRGNFKSNLQFTRANGKTRIGAFGIKGWVSSI